MMYGDIEYVDGAGAVMRLRGTGTEEEEAPILNMGYGYRAPSADYNAEAFAMSLNSDVDQKYVIASIPRDKQRQWAAGTSGVQNAFDPERAIEFGPDGVWIKEGTVFLGNDKGFKVTIADGGNMTIEGSGTINFVCDQLQHNGVNVGDDHKHTGVEPGGGITGNPVGG